MAGMPEVTVEVNDAGVPVNPFSSTPKQIPGHALRVCEGE